MRKVTVVFDDDELYTAVKVKAARLNRPVKALVTEALEAWLEAQEEIEDLADYDERMAQHRSEGGIPWEVVRARVHEILAERERKHTGTPSEGD